MNEKKTKYRYWVTFFLEDLPLGHTFKPGLLHITVIPWFVISGEEQEMAKSFHKHFSNLKSFDAKVGPKTQFGPQKEVSASLVNAPGLSKIHKMALQWFGRIDARWAVKNPHVGNDYKPHIRHRRGTRLTSDKLLHIESLELVRAQRQEDNVREIAAKVSFK